MMSKAYSLLLLLPFLMLSIAVKAQDVTIPNPFEFKIIDSTSATKAELYTRARAWIATIFKSAQDVIQMDDKEAGKIIGKANLLAPVRGGFGDVLCNAPISYTITIDVKDGKYRMILDNFYHHGCFTGKYTSPAGGDIGVEERPRAGLYTMTKKAWRRIREDAYSDCKTIIASFQSAMKNASVKTSDGF